jgi:hypothetical protein
MAEDQREQFSSTEDETQAEAGDETRVETFTIDGSEDETNELDNAETKTEDSEQPLINQEAVNKRINELTKEKYEERRKREALEARLSSMVLNRKTYNKQTRRLLCLLKILPWHSLFFLRMNLLYSSSILRPI